MATWTEISELPTNRPVVLMDIALPSTTLRYSLRDIEMVQAGTALFYEGRVLRFGSVSRSLSDSNTSMQVGSVSSVLSNADGALSTLDMNYVWNRFVTYRIGFLDSTVPLKTLFRGVITGIKFVETEFHIAVTESVRKWQDKSFGSRILETSWPNSGQSVAGKRMKIIYGEVRGVI